ncbi:MAG: YaiI/YqxD family protein [Methylococcales bacterium]|nr:YaiI/YqxD family protein [Methylococcales bacterium]MBT7442375.1 YaiI/YqxD family protein [Methylococcales bacterium]
MKIWVDADACPVAVKDILFRVANRVKVDLTLVANQPMKTPPSKNIKAIQVSQGFDEADNRIVELAEQGDLVITGDIPLASDVIDKGAHALNPRGEWYTTENIKERLNMRDFMEVMRSSGVDTRGGPPPFGQKEKQAFANALDRFIAQNHQ